MIWPRASAKNPVPTEALAADPVSTTYIFTTFSENCLKISAVALTACAGARPGRATMENKNDNAAMATLRFIDKPYSKYARWNGLLADRYLRYRSGDPSRLEFADHLAAKSQLAENFRAMFAQQRRRAGFFFGEIFEPHWTANKLQCTSLGMLELLLQPNVLDLAIVEHFSEIVERRGGNIAALQALEPLLA
jgi:hypothetical protein